MSVNNVIGVVIDGVTGWHAVGVISDYTTLCGLDAEDPSIGHGGTVAATRSQKISCPTCRNVWKNTRALRLRDQNFEADLLTAKRN